MGSANDENDRNTASGFSTWMGDVAETLIGLEGAVRRDEPDAVHRARTMTRRLRVALPLVPGDAAREARRRLTAYGRLLGAARDLEVRGLLAERLLDELEGSGNGGEESEPGKPGKPGASGKPDKTGESGGAGEHGMTGKPGGSEGRLDSLDTDAARDRLVHSARRDYRKAHTDVVDYLDKPAYRRLVERLDAATAHAASVDRLAVLHEARKAARALRYLAEAVGDTRRAELARTIQDELGDHRDHTLLARALDGADDAALTRLRELARDKADALVPKSGPDAGGPPRGER
ncbi:MAG TPA: CHAD domain-containing protein [Gryllotalpicola sp.]